MEYKINIYISHIKKTLKLYSTSARTPNCALLVLLPHLCRYGTALHFDAIGFVLEVSKLLCRKCRLIMSMSVVWLVARQQPSGLPVLPNHRAHRGLPSSELWDKYARTGRTPRGVSNIVQYGSSPAACG